MTDKKIQNAAVRGKTRFPGIGAYAKEIGKNVHHVRWVLMGKRNGPEIKAGYFARHPNVPPFEVAEKEKGTK